MNTVRIKSMSRQSKFKLENKENIKFKPFKKERNDLG